MVRIAATLTLEVLNQDRDINKVIIVVLQVHLKEVVLDARSLELFVRDQLFKVDSAGVFQVDTDSVDITLVVTCQSADGKVTIHLKEAIEVTFEVIPCQEEPQFTHDANTKILVVKTGSKLDFFAFLDDSKAIFTLIVKPRNWTDFKPCIIVVVWVCIACRIGLDRVFEELADDILRLVQVQHAQIGKKLALLDVFESCASDSCIKIIVLNRATNLTCGRNGPLSVTSQRLN